MSSKKKHPKKSKYSIKKPPKFIKITRRILPVLLAFLIPIIFFTLPTNKQWLDKRVWRYFKEMNGQIKNLNVNKRKEERHGNTYRIVNYVCQNVPKNSWFLMLPQAYYLDKMYDFQKTDEIRELYHHISILKIFNFHCQDINLVTMKMNNDLISKAEYSLIISEDKRIQVVKITDNNMLENLKSRFTYNVDSASNTRAVAKVLSQIQNN